MKTVIIEKEFEPDDRTDLCDSCSEFIELARKAEAKATQFRQLCIDVITCMPGYAGCGDISREQRVVAECKELLGDDMPRALHERGCTDILLRPRWEE